MDEISQKLSEFSNIHLKFDPKIKNGLQNPNDNDTHFIKLVEVSNKSDKTASKRYQANDTPVPNKKIKSEYIEIFDTSGSTQMTDHRSSSASTSPTPPPIIHGRINRGHHRQTKSSTVPSRKVHIKKPRSTITRVQNAASEAAKSTSGSFSGSYYNRANSTKG